MKRANIALAASLLTACASASASTPMASGTRGTLITPSGQSSSVEWSAAEQAQQVALRNLRRSPEASFHLLRIRAEQTAHVHERSDLVLMLLAGSLTVTLDDRVLPLKPGDVVEIPRGAPYALKNTGAQPSAAYLVYTPALDLQDYKPVGASRSRDSAWQWNLWLQ